MLIYLQDYNFYNKILIIYKITALEGGGQVRWNLYKSITVFGSMFEF